jgi:NAD(P)-dependent dehydrogenase (short-subunit alcohol dehydrogenase family)
MTGKAALITGAARRIGRALALHFAAEGWDVGLHYHSSAAAAAALEAEIAALGRCCRRYPADLAEPEAALAVAAAFRRDFPNARLLINSASIFRRDRLATLEPGLWDEHMRINALAPALLTRAFAAAPTGPMSVINLLDQKVGNLTPDFFSYTASKAALAAITRMLAMELAPTVRVNAIAPGLVLRSGAQTEPAFERAFAATPLGLGPTLGEICRAASLFADSPSITGQTIAIDGGRQLAPGRPPYDDLPAG